MRQAGFVVGNVVDVEKQGTGDVLGQILGPRIAVGGWQMPAAIQHNEIRRGEVARQPIRFDDPVLGSLRQWGPQYFALFKERRNAPCT